MISSSLSLINICRDDSNDLWVMTDRSEGATSMKSGEIEIMVHRYCND